MASAALVLCRFSSSCSANLSSPFAGHTLQACRLACTATLSHICLRGLQVMLVDNPKAAKEAYAQIVRSKRVAMTVEGPDGPGGEGKIRLVQVCTHDAAAAAVLWRFLAALFASHSSIYEQLCGHASEVSRNRAILTLMGLGVYCNLHSAVLCKLPTAAALPGNHLALLICML